MDGLRSYIPAWGMEGVDAEAIVSVVGGILDAKGDDVTKEYTRDRATIVVDVAGDLCMLTMHNIDGCDGIFYSLTMKEWRVDLMVVKRWAGDGDVSVDADLDVGGDLSTIVEDFVTLRLHV